MLFIIVLEAISRKTRSAYLEELLYLDELGLVSESHEDLKRRLEAWKGALKSKSSG